MADEKKRPGLGTWIVLSIFLLSAALFLAFLIIATVRLKHPGDEDNDISSLEEAE